MRIALHKYYIFISVSALLLLVHGCKTSSLDPNPAETGIEYFPLQKGSYIVYDVMKIVYPNVGKNDTSIYQLKVRTADFFQENEETAFKIERFVRTNAQQPWPDSPDSVWTAYRNAYRAVLTENNIPFIKLSFPLSDGHSWDGNALNNLEDEFGKIKDTYKATKLGSSFTEGQLSFPTTVTVIQEDFADPIVKKELSIEVFGKNVGLLHKEYQYIYYDQNFPPNSFIIDHGVKYFQKINSYGKE